jgi:hypothetical protein
MMWPLGTHKRWVPDAHGRFGTHRRFDIHTGVDLYCDPGCIVQAPESGWVVGYEHFTGAHAPGSDSSPWWNDTYALILKSNSGRYWLLGEMTPYQGFIPGSDVIIGEPIGVVDIPVLKRYKGRPRYMLHVEQYQALPPGYTGWYVCPGDVSASVWWKHGEPKPSRLIDPTPDLERLSNGRFEVGMDFVEPMD